MSVSKRQLIPYVQKNTVNISRRRVYDFVSAITDIMQQELLSGNEIKINGFGTLYCDVDVKNINTQTLQFEEQVTVKFKQSDTLTKLLKFRFKILSGK